MKKKDKSEVFSRPLEVIAPSTDKKENDKIKVSTPLSNDEFGPSKSSGSADMTNDPKKSSNSKREDTIIVSDDESMNEMDEKYSSDNMSAGDDSFECSEKGGILTYLNPSIESSSLLDVIPITNTLNLVYRTKGVHRFMQYIREDNTKTPFYEFSFVYKF